MTSGDKNQTWLYTVNVASHLGHEFKTKEEEKKNHENSEKSKYSQHGPERNAFSQTSPTKPAGENTSDPNHLSGNKRNSVYDAFRDSRSSAAAAALHANMFSYSKKPDSSGFKKLRPDFTHSSLLIFSEEMFFFFCHVYKQKHAAEAAGQPNVKQR